MKLFSNIVVAALASMGVMADQVILDPPSTPASAKPIALIMVHGMQCKPEAYKTMAEEFQTIAASQGYKAWVGMPEFVFDVPEPVLIDHYVTDMVN
mmetsp:Transcript_16542/g.28122  ORF Transcript_16542/g.28122 Transcript_16542/m.28122 type:complete len:96 (-) Transcript_16542:1385-1672(-)